jgi:hypothetical protein
VVFEKIHAIGVTFLEAEDNAPIAANGNAPKAFQIPGEAMQAKSVDIHVLNGHGGIQTAEHQNDLIGQIRPYFAPVVMFVKPPQTAMPKAPDHRALSSDKWRLSTAVARPQRFACRII